MDLRISQAAYHLKSRAETFYEKGIGKLDPRYKLSNTISFIFTADQRLRKKTFRNLKFSPPTSSDFFHQGYNASRNICVILIWMYFSRFVECFKQITLVIKIETGVV